MQTIIAVFKYPDMATNKLVYVESLKITNLRFFMPCNFELWTIEHKICSGFYAAGIRKLKGGDFATGGAIIIITARFNKTDLRHHTRPESGF